MGGKYHSFLGVDVDDLGVEEELEVELRGVRFRERDGGITLLGVRGLISLGEIVRLLGLLGLGVAEEDGDDLVVRDFNLS